MLSANPSEKNDTSRRLNRSTDPTLNLGGAGGITTYVYLSVLRVVFFANTGSTTTFRSLTIRPHCDHLGPFMFFFSEGEGGRVQDMYPGGIGTKRSFISEGVVAYRRLSLLKVLSRLAAPSGKVWLCYTRNPRDPCDPARDPSCFSRDPCDPCYFSKEIRLSLFS